MEPHIAEEHLQVIRTLMERSALYRRTLTPIMLWIGSVGVLASLGGIALDVEATRPFGGWWFAAAVVAVAGAFLIARRQAFRDGEPFWSPPTRRVTQALAPPLAAGLLFAVTLMVQNPAHIRWPFTLSTVLFYGCAVHAAGFFMPRGMKLFGWLLIAAAAAVLLAVPWSAARSDPWVDHASMGAFFGVLHLAYGVYLHVTERREPVA